MDFNKELLRKSNMSKERAYKIIERYTGKIGNSKAVCLHGDPNGCKFTHCVYSDSYPNGACLSINEPVYCGTWCGK